MAANREKTMIKKLLNGLVARRLAERRAELYRNLIRHEARLGGQLFGELPSGGRREFFCLDEHSWVWHEEWSDTAGRQHIQTTRYDFWPGSIVKLQNGKFGPVGFEEAKHLARAIDLYHKRVRRDLYAFAI